MSTYVEPPGSSIFVQSLPQFAGLLFEAEPGAYPVTVAHSVAPKTLVTEPTVRAPNSASPPSIAANRDLFIRFSVSP